MDQQMLQALFTPNSNQHTQSLDYLQQLKDSKDAWKLCAATLASSGISLDDRSKFVCLQILQHHAKTNYSTASVEEQNILRQNLSQWLSALCLAPTAEKVFIRSKTAQLLSLVFVVDFTERWPTFVNDLHLMLSLGPNAIDLYLKILLAIDTEVVDRDGLHSQADVDRNTLLKDLMRERCVVDMADSWYNILVKYEKSHPELVCHCLDVMGAYISWIDINLIANERFVDVLVKQLKDPLLREAAADCIREILQKGMEPIAKTQLIESFFTVLDQAGVLKPVDDDDSDFLVKLSKLVNCIGVQLILAWEKLNSKDGAKREAVRLAVENKITLLLQFMASDYDDVSENTFDFARDYIQLIKQSGHLTEVERGQMENMLYVIVSKSKYDESYNFNFEGEDEAMFDEYRKQLKVVFDNLASLVPEIALKVSKDYVTTTLNRWQASPFEDVEAALYLFFSLGEALPASHGNHFSGPSQAKSNTLGELMRLMISSGASRHSHPSVILQYFECISRYEKFFNGESHYIPEVLASFMDQRGMRNPSSKVRSRSAYLFSRFVRCLKTQLNSFTEHILSQIAELLILTPFDEGQTTSLLSNDDQLYVYESAAILIIAGQGDAQRKQMLMRNLLSPIFSKVAILTERLSTEVHSVKQIATAAIICHATSVTARTSKAFSNQNTMQSCHCVPLYLEALQLFIASLNVGVEREVIGSGVRQLMHRLVVCLSVADLLPILPAASQTLLQSPHTFALTEYLPLINQIITKFKKEVIGFVRDIFTPLISAIFNALSQELDGDEEEERRMQKFLQKSYYLFLTTIIINGISEVFVSQDPSVLQRILMSVIQGALEFPEASIQKNCFLILRRLTESWGEKEQGPPHFVEFLYSQVIPSCFMAPLKTTFDLNDAQSLLALHESAMCLRAIYEVRGDEMLTFLRTDYLPKLELSPELVNEYCQALTADSKMFRNYTKLFFQRVKS